MDPLASNAIVLSLLGPFQVRDHHVARGKLQWRVHKLLLQPRRYILRQANWHRDRELRKEDQGDYGETWTNIPPNAEV